MRFIEVRMSGVVQAGRMAATVCCGLAFMTGCWAPLRSPGIPAHELGEEFRTPQRTAGEPTNFAALTVPSQGDYVLGPGDQVEVTLFSGDPDAPPRVMRSQVMANGEIFLPLLGATRVAGWNLVQANEEILKAYAATRFFTEGTTVNLTLLQPSKTSVVVLGEVTRPGVQELAKYANDVPHALATAGGLTDDAANVIEIHRRESTNQLQRMQVQEALNLVEPGSAVQLAELKALETVDTDPARVLRIPLRGTPEEPLRPEDLTLQNGDVVVVRSRTAQVFYVTGRLASVNFIRFNLGARERDLGAGFLLPQDREIDVVTAVAMAGYIDAIESPTTVTVHRRGPDGQPMRIIVDLIAARFDRCENVYIEPGDIIYLNPDLGWWFRRATDRLVSSNLFRFGVGYNIPNSSGP